MNSIVEKRRKVLINTAYFALIFAAVFAAYRWLLPFLIPFLFAFAAAGILNRPIIAISKRTPLKRSWLSAAFVIMLVLIIAVVFFLIGMELVETVTSFYDYSVAQLNNITDLVNDLKLWILDVTSFLPEALPSAERTP